jgi:hypothetical protein
MRVSGAYLPAATSFLKIFLRYRCGGKRIRLPEKRMLTFGLPQVE